MKTTAIVLSAGKGRRMHTKIPKQYIHIEGKPILYYSLKAFEESEIDEIVLVTGSEDVKYCKENIVELYGLKKVKAIINGGKERYDSVYNGLAITSDTDYVFIHDGARPLITSIEINHLKEQVEKYKACVAGVMVKDTIKIVNENNIVIETPNRKRVWTVQTPQAFAYTLIKDAYDLMMKGNKENITDDAMVLERYGTYPVKMIEASYKNIKVTTQEDIIMVESLLKRCE